MSRNLSIALAAAACMSLASAGHAQASDTSVEREAVRRAVLDYVEGFYEGDTAKLARALRPDMYKYGFWRAGGATTYTGSQMTHAAALAYARRVKEQNQQTPASAPKVVELYDVQDQTASAKLTARWGTDYMLLAKYDGRWMVTHVLWQGPNK